jgi:hypothetical protein
LALETKSMNSINKSMMPIFITTLENIYNVFGGQIILDNMTSRIQFVKALGHGIFHERF